MRSSPPYVVTKVPALMKSRARTPQPHFSVLKISRGTTRGVRGSKGAGQHCRTSQSCSLARARTHLCDRFAPLDWDSHHRSRRRLYIHRCRDRYRNWCGWVTAWDAILLAAQLLSRINAPPIQGDSPDVSWLDPTVLIISGRDARWPNASLLLPRLVDKGV